jgi:hypothetical protein
MIQEKAIWSRFPESEYHAMTFAGGELVSGGRRNRT